MKTLEQLKQELAEEEANAQPEETEVITEDNQEETETAEVETEAVEVEEEVEEEAETETAEAKAEEETETELWMQEEEQTSSSNDEQTFSSSDMKGLRLKNKAKLEEKDSEIAELKKQVEQLVNGQQPTQATELKRPKLEDFDYDEDKHAQAMEDYLLAKVNQSNQVTQQQAQQQAQQAQAAKAKEESLGNHYNQVKELVESKVITKDSYANAETVVRNAMDKLSPGNGDEIADDLIANLASLGEGSAKVLFHLGKNKASLSRITNALSSGNVMGAMAILGELKGKLTAKPAKKISSAPKPSSLVKGDETVVSSANKLQRKYKDAMRSGNSQTAFDAIREAKAAGVDVNSWS